MPPSPAKPSLRDRLAFGVAAVVAVVVFALAGVAEARPRVLISRPPVGVSELTALIRGELAALAIEVVVEAMGPPSEERFDAVVRISEAPREVTVWLAADLQLSTYSADPRPVAGRDEALARQVAEVLRAELLLSHGPRRTDDDPARGEEAVTDVTTVIEGVETVRPPSPDWPTHAAEPPIKQALAVLAVTPALTISPGPLATQPHLGVDLELFVWRRLRLQALGLVPLHEAEVDDARGTIYARTALAGASIGYDLAPGPWHFTPAIGAGWQFIQTTADARAPIRAATTPPIS